MPITINTDAELAAFFEAAKAFQKTKLEELGAVLAGSGLDELKAKLEAAQKAMAPGGQPSQHLSNVLQILQSLPSFVAQLITSVAPPPVVELPMPQG